MNKLVLNQVFKFQNFKSSVQSLVQNRNASNFIVEKANDYAILKFNKPPVNSLNLDALKELKDQFEAFEIDSSVKGVVLTSVS